MLFVKMLLNINTFVVLSVIVHGYNSLNTDDCPRNETYFECGPNCEKKCSNLQTDCNTFDLILCPGGCYCLAGYARNFKGNCILEGECGQVACGRNEIFLNCGCDLYCDNLFSCGTNSDSAACTEGCYCSPGYVRNKNDKCIRQSNCNKVV